MLHCAYRGGQRGQSPPLNPIPPPRSALALIALYVPMYIYTKKDVLFVVFLNEHLFKFCEEQKDVLLVVFLEA